MYNVLFTAVSETLLELSKDIKKYIKGAVIKLIFKNQSDTALLLFVKDLLN